MIQHAKAALSKKLQRGTLEDPTVAGNNSKTYTSVDNSNMDTLAGVSLSVQLVDLSYKMRRKVIYQR